MKFISLFTKPPSHKRFSYAPRYYDPKEEERKEREDRIRREVEREQGLETSGDRDYRNRITGSFQSARRRSKGPVEMSSSLLRLGVLLFLSLLLIAYFTWGKVVIYSLLLFVPFYFYLKFKQRSKA